MGHSLFFLQLKCGRVRQHNGNYFISLRCGWSTSRYTENKISTIKWCYVMELSAYNLMVVILKHNTITFLILVWIPLMSHLARAGPLWTGRECLVRGEEHPTASNVLAVSTGEVDLTQTQLFPVSVPGVKIETPPFPSFPFWPVHTNHPRWWHIFWFTVTYLHVHLLTINKPPWLSVFWIATHSNKTWQLPKIVQRRQSIKK